MAKRICMEFVIGQCRNPMKGTPPPPGMECPFCLRENGKDGNGDQIFSQEKTDKVFELLKDKIKE